MNKGGTKTVDVPTLAQTKRSIDDFLDAFCRQQIKRAAAISPAYVELWEVMCAYFATGGKRIRPYLTILAYRACGGASEEDILTVAAAWELLHGCMLMHDDIIDRDDMRHGQPNISGVYRHRYGQSTEAAHYADSTALIAGDLALSAAYHVIIKSGLEDSAKQLMCEQLENAMFTVAGGELLDIQATMDSPKTTNAMIIARTKTAEYSCAGPLRSGALLAGANEQTVAALHDFGMTVGTAYQLADDILGVVGNEARTGKPTDSDIREGKRTEILRQTYLRLSDAEAQTIDNILAKRRSMSAQEVETVRQLIQTSGSLEAVRFEIDKLEQKARDIVAAMPFTDEYRQLFAGLVDSFLHRDT